MSGIVPIGDARRISRERNCPIIVVFAIHPDRERFTVASYGATKALCRVGADYANQFAEAVLGSKVIASSVEPVNLPDAPATWVPQYAARPRDMWHGDHGSVLWWKFPVCEPPYVGSPLDDDFPEHVTHWTPIVVPPAPAEEGAPTS